jgi:hypothetical protein
MKDRDQPVLLGRQASEAVDALQQRLPLARRERLRNARPARGALAIRAEALDDHEVHRASGGQQLAGRAADLQRAGGALGRVQLLEDVAADQFELAVGELAAQRPGVVGEVSERSELGPVVPGVCDVGEQALPARVAAVPRVLDAPRGWRVRDANLHRRDARNGTAAGAVPNRSIAGA